MSSYKIMDIEGIGPVYAQKLMGAGIKTTAALLKKAADKKGRVALAGETGLDESNILEWVNRADLMRVNGVGEEYSDLLENAGVDTVKELRTRNALNLHKAMLETNAAKKLVRQAPSLSMVEKWIAHAKTLAPMVTH